MVRAAVVETEALSVTFTVTFAGPAFVGVPETTPPAERFRPAGKDPADTVQEYGGVPPDAPSDCEYAVPTVPGGREELLMLSAAGPIVSDSPAVVETEALSVTFAVKFEVPAVVGVPEIVPAADSVSPAGSDPADTVHEYGDVPPDALSPCE
jgi:hypothetical protein